MKWYSKYLQVYEQPFASAPPEVVGFVKKKVAEVIRKQATAGFGCSHLP